jgi:hypothetical protein
MELVMFRVDFVFVCVLRFCVCLSVCGLILCLFVG